MTTENPRTHNGEGTCRPADLPEFRVVGSRQFVILVVDDNAVFRRLVTVLLQRDGYSVLSASDGQEALQLSREYCGSIDVVITDQEMPRLTGADLCAHLLAERPGIQTILMSGIDMSKTVGHYLGLPFLLKPFDGETLRTRIRAILTAPFQPPMYQLPTIR